MPSNPTTLLSTISYPQMSDLFRRTWLDTQDYMPRRARQLFKTRNNMQGASMIFNEFDVDTYADTKPEGAAMTKAKIGIGYDKLLRPKVVAKQVDVTYEQRRQNRYDEVESEMLGLGEFVENRIDLDLSHRFTFANATSMTDMNGNTIDLTTGDGLSLVSAAHTLAYSTTTYSNRVPGDPAFSQTAFQQALNLARTQTYNNLGQRRSMNWSTIFSGDDAGTEQSIKQMLQSTADVDSANSGVVNIYRGQWNYVMLPNLSTDAYGAYDATKRRWWGLLATGPKGWNGIYAEWDAPRFSSPTPGSNGEDIDTLNWTYATYAMYGVVTPGPRGLIMSMPTN